MSLSTSDKKSIQKAVADGTEGMDYGYDRIYKRSQIIRQLADKYGVSALHIEDVLAAGRQAKPEPVAQQVSYEDIVPDSGPGPNIVPAPAPSPERPGAITATSGTVEERPHPAKTTSKRRR